MNVDVVDRTSEAYYWCINEINCTGTNMSKDLLYAIGEAEANMYLCSKEHRPCENEVYPFVYDEAVANEQLVSFIVHPSVTAEHNLTHFCIQHPTAHH